jgi:hypothetical protein
MSITHGLPLPVLGVLGVLERARHRVTPFGRRRARALYDAEGCMAMVVRDLADSDYPRSTALEEAARVIEARILPLVEHLPFGARAQIDGTWGEFLRGGSPSETLGRATREELHHLACSVASIHRVVERARAEWS